MSGLTLVLDTSGFYIHAFTSPQEYLGLRYVKNISGFEGRYSCDNQGGIYSFKFNQWRKLQLSASGQYLDCELRGRRYKAHRIIAETWVLNPDPVNCRYVDHVNRRPRDNRAENLRWVTARENTKNRNMYLTESQGVDERTRDDYEETVRKIRTLIDEYYKRCEALDE